MAGSANNVVISPVNVLWRIEASEQVDFAGLTGLDVKGKFFNISTAKDSILNYVWGDDSVESDPVPVGRIAIPFTVAGDGDSATTLATAAASAIDGASGYVATASGTVVSIHRDAVGLVTDTVDVDMSVAITICRRGKDFDLGLLQGDIEMTLSPANFIVQAHQTGVTPRAALFQGIETLEASTAMLETQNSQLSEIYGLYGTRGFTPSAGTSVFGVGTSRQGDNLLIDAARIVLKDVNAVDDLNNRSLMLAIPIPDSLVFSGENPRTLNLTWQGFVDEQIDNKVSGLLFGDETQAGLRV